MKAQLSDEMKMILNDHEDAGRQLTNFMISGAKKGEVILSDGTKLVVERCRPKYEINDKKDNFFKKILTKLFG